MCITFFYLNTNKNQKKRLIIAFNRDEAADRETLPFAHFSDDPNIYAGRDLLSGGTWLGINVKTGVIVLLTNYRLWRRRIAKSRGLLVRYFLSTNYTKDLPANHTPQQLTSKIQEDLSAVLKNKKEYSPYNLCVYNIRDNKMLYICSETDMKEPLHLPTDTVLGFSNSDINATWNKVVHGKDMFRNLLTSLNLIGKEEDEECSNEELFGGMEKVMKNTEGTGWLWKHFDASIFINPYYKYIFRKQYMTRSTFYAILSEQEDRMVAEIRQVTYQRSGQQSSVSMKLNIQ